MLSTSRASHRQCIDPSKWLVTKLQHGGNNKGSSKRAFYILTVWRKVFFSESWWFKVLSEQKIHYWWFKVLSEHKIQHQVIQNKTDNWFRLIARGAISLLVECWTWEKQFLLFRVTGSISERCCTFYLFGQQLQLGVWNYIQSKLLPISFQKKNSSSYYIKIVRQEMTLYLRCSLLPSYCRSSPYFQVLTTSTVNCANDMTVGRTWEEREGEKR